MTDLPARYKTRTFLVLARERDDNIIYVMSGPVDAVKQVYASVLALWRDECATSAARGRQPWTRMLIDILVGRLAGGEPRVFDNYTALAAANARVTWRVLKADDRRLDDLRTGGHMMVVNANY